MKKFTKILCLLLVACMLMTALAACGGNGDGEDTKDPADTSGVAGDNTPDDVVDLRTLTTEEAMYDYVLGEYDAYYAASKEATTISERFALMAIAEAKLLESGVMVPVQSNGGNYAVSKVAPYTISPVLYGSDSDRYHNALVATTPITPADRDALKAIYAEKKGTGTYEAEAKAYLEANGYTLQRTYTLNYTSDPDNLDIHASSKQVNSAVLVNIYDNLVEYDGENVLQPALATDWNSAANDDGTVTWTFKIREGVEWVNSSGEALADLTADDFVAGFQHMLDDASEQLSWLISDKIVGVDAYLHKHGDFADVGVKAEDDYTLTITLIENVPYFETMLTYSTFAPLCRSYYESLGGEFGFGNDNPGTYASDKDHLAYCGPYVISTLTEKTSVVFDKNEKYWNAENINLDKISWVFVDSASDPTRAYQNFVDGLVDGSGLNNAALQMAKDNGDFDKYAYVSAPDATCFPGFFNINRGGFVSPYDENEQVSAQTDAMKERAHLAMLNQNFRLALATGLDRGSYMAASVGEDLKYASMGNMYTIGNFVSTTEEITVSINGTDKTYPAGTFYGEITQDQLTADGFNITVWDPTQESGLGSSSGFDGWYNPEDSAKYIAKAVEELAVSGVEISAENPLHLDYSYMEDGSTNTAMANVVKTSIEAATNGLVVVDLLGTEDQYSYLYSTYYFENPSEGNYDITLNSGWGPDYGDPSTFLDTMIKGGGYMLKMLGLGV